VRGIVDWFLPDADARFRPFDRRRLLVIGGLASGLVSSLFVVHRFVLEPGPGARHADIVAASVALWMCPFVLRFTGSLRLASHLLMLSLTAFVTVDAVLYGGLGSPPTAALLLLPLLAVFFLGVRAGVAYAVLAANALILIFLLQRAQLVGPPPGDAVAQMHLAASLGLVLFIALMSSLYDL